MFNYQIHYERIIKTLEELWDISTDNSITEENKIKIIRDVSRSTLDGEPTTADEYNNEEYVRISDINKEIARNWKKKRNKNNKE